MKRTGQLIKPRHRRIRESRQTWRDYQNRLNGPRKRKAGRWLAVCLAVLAAMAVFIVANGHIPPGDTTPPPFAAGTDANDTMLSKSDVQLLLSQLPSNQLLTERIDLPFKNQEFQIHTSLDVGLQNHLIEALDRKNSRYIGIISMDAQSGKILTMVGFDKTDPKANPCLRSSFPAASLFKIVTAAAAVDQCAYTGSTQVRFNGYKHTLYKKQLKETNNRYTTTITFADSFAQSVNPVFGKLGTLYLGKTVLEQYGLGFGFNQPIDFELPVTPSHLVVSDRPYNWAEIASGFNNDTTLSPLHAAVIVSAVLNDGRLLTPSIIDRIEDGKGRTIYLSHAAWHQRAMTTKATKVLTAMMVKTVQSGTGRRPFRGSQRDPVLSKLQIGGKTGSIDNRSHDERFDWFVGFAQEKNGHKGLIVAVLVAHEEYIGRRAGTYARMAMSYFFKNHLAQQKKVNSPTNG